MRRVEYRRVILVALVLCSIGSTGCRAPRPSFNFWAPFGSSRVAPPKTGSYSATPNYYPKDGAPAAGATTSAPPASFAPRPAVVAPEPTTTPATPPSNPVPAIDPGTDFPVQPPAGSDDSAMTEPAQKLRVGKWRPPRHVPQVRPVSFEAPVSEQAEQLKSVPPTVPAVVVPVQPVSPTSPPRELTREQTRQATPLGRAVPTPAAPATDSSGQVGSQVKSTASSRWVERGNARRE